jgi:histidinol-phosphate/aromatic aminotransferase/cobyric acid decarboxylase-like protein/GNAT superfamily N-acetyltransferase
MYKERGTIALALATERDREAIYAIRHQVYARELGQHAPNADARLTDALDAVNVYLVARIGGTVAGFVSITPPGDAGYSIDKYFARDDVAVRFDRGLYEVRLLTVSQPHRGAQIAVLLMYAALRYLDSAGATTVVAIGRLDLLGMYTRAGLTPLGLRAKSGSVTYELMAAEVHDLRARASLSRDMLARLERIVDWQLEGVPFRITDGCYHGGAFFDAIGDEFDTLDTRDRVISADVLDAWFDPAPAVVDKVARYLPFALKTSPPTGCEGMRRAIARARGVPEESILPGAGSSDLIFAGLRQWITPASRVLILDPMYAEYAHVLESVIGARVDRLPLPRARGYDVDVDELAARAARGYDWIVLVNPNSPTGRHVPRAQLERVLSTASSATRWWIDETYVEYAGPGQSLEAYAAASTNVVVCKSMSKVYALSGVRAAYLCGPSRMMEELRPQCPPWSVSLPGQIAACEALQNIAYYQGRWAETHRLREALSASLGRMGWDVVPGCANFLLCHLPATQPEAAALVEACRKHNLFVRDVANMGTGFDTRTLRIAVKDAATNAAMIEVLQEVLAEMARMAGTTVAA